MSLRSLVVLAALLLAAPLLASTHTWLGTSSERISDPRNWSGGSPVGDPEATLLFPGDAARFEVTNDVAGLRFRAITFEDSRYVLSGELLVALDATLNGGRFNPKLACPLRIEGTLTVYGGNDEEGFELAGPIGGSGGIHFGSSLVTMSGNASNTYGGPTVLGGARLRLNKSGGATAIPGDLRAERFPFSFFNQLTVLAPEQIADLATVRWAEGAGGLLVTADETIGTFEAGSMSVLATTPLPTFTIANLVVKGNLTLTPNLRLLQSALDVPAGRSLEFSFGKVSVPAEGITLRGEGNVRWRGDYAAPTRIDGVQAFLSVANSDVTVASGTFTGEAKSIVATGGALRSEVTSASSIRLGPGARVVTPLIQLHGALELGGATLIMNRPNLDPQRRVIITNTSTEPVTGRFAGIEENGIVENLYRVSYRGGSGNDVTLTKLQRLYAPVTLTQTPKPGLIGEPVTFEVLVTGSHGVPTGSIGVSTQYSGEPVLTVPLIAGRATFSMTFDAVAALYIYYSGDATYTSSSPSFGMNLTYRKPVLTSIDPPGAPAGGPVTVTLRGSDFYPGARILGVSTENIVFVSPSEIRATLDLSYAVPGSTLQIVVATPDGNVLSDAMAFPVAAEDGPLSFDDRGAIARVTAGAKTVWMRTVSGTPQAIHTATDDDRDGILRWDPPAPLPTSTWGVVDRTTGDFAIGGNHGARPVVLPFPAHTFPRDPEGNASQFVLRVGDPPLNVWRMLWVRPGVGVWLQTAVDGADTDRLRNNILFGSVDLMASLGDSPPHPAGFAEGDVVLLFPFVSISLSERVYAARLTAQDLEDAPGVLQAATLRWGVSEREGVVKLPVVRIGGAAGSVSVRYTTIERTAVDGVHFQHTSGTLTFGPGEIIQRIEVPLFNDQLYRGDSVFNVELSDPVGTTLGGETAFVVGLVDDELAPTVTIDETIRYVVETDAPQVVSIPLTLTGATTLPVTVTWRTSANLGNESGRVTFAAGETRKYVSVVIPANDDLDGNKDFSVEFAGSRLVGARSFRILMRDDEAPFVRASDVTVDEDAGMARVILTIPAALTEPFFVHYMTNSPFTGTAARPPSDYTFTSGSVAFNPGMTHTTIAIPIIDDEEAQGDLSFRLMLFLLSTLVERASIPIVIVDDEVTARPTVSIEDVQIPEPAVLDRATITLRLSAASSRQVTVHYQTADGSATAGLDYRGITDLVVFWPGETVKTIVVPVFGDPAVEEDESFGVKLGSVVNATMADDSAVVTIVDNDKERRRAAGR